MAVKMEDLKVGMEIAFSSLDNVDYDGWKVELNTPYLITKAVDWRVEVNLYSEELGNFYVECDELKDVYIFDSNKKEENKELVFTDAKVVGFDNLNLKHSTLEVLNLITRHYDSIPSDLIRELVNGDFRKM